MDCDTQIGWFKMVNFFKFKFYSWTKYGTIGKVIPGSKFIAFKTPLSDEFFIGKPETPFGLKDVVETVSTLQIHI